jgi:hypothetical protein
LQQQQQQQQQVRWVPVLAVKVAPTALHSWARHLPRMCHRWMQEQMLTGRWHLGLRGRQVATPAQQQQQQQWWPRPAVRRGSRCHLRWTHTAGAPQTSRHLQRVACQPLQLPRQQEVQQQEQQQLLLHRCRWMAPTRAHTNRPPHLLCRQPAQAPAAGRQAPPAHSLLPAAAARGGHQLGVAQQQVGKPPGTLPPPPQQCQVRVLAPCPCRGPHP